MIEYSQKSSVSAVIGQVLPVVSSGQLGLYIISYRTSFDRTLNDRT